MSPWIDGWVADTREREREEVGTVFSCNGIVQLFVLASPVSQRRGINEYMEGASQYIDVMDGGVRVAGSRNTARHLIMSRLMGI